MLMSGMASASMAARALWFMSSCMADCGVVVQTLLHVDGTLCNSFTYEHEHGLDLPVIVDRHDLTVISPMNFYCREGVRVTLPSHDYMKVCIAWTEPPEHRDSQL